MKDLFDEISSIERKLKRERAPRRSKEELRLESEALNDAMGGTYSDRSYFDLDHALAATTRSGRGESLEDFEIEGGDDSEW